MFDARRIVAAVKRLYTGLNLPIGLRDAGVMTQVRRP
jgi:hypothetical protein